MRTVDVCAFGTGTGKRALFLSGAFVMDLILMYKQHLNMTAVRTVLHEGYSTAYAQRRNSIAAFESAGVLSEADSDRKAYECFIKDGPPSTTVLWSLFDTVFETTLRPQCEDFQTSTSCTSRSSVPLSRRFVLSRTTERRSCPWSQSRRHIQVRKPCRYLRHFISDRTISRSAFRSHRRWHEDRRHWCPVQ